MKRSVKWFSNSRVAVLVAPQVLADVKTQEKTTFKMEGFMGAIVNRMPAATTA